MYLFTYTDAHGQRSRHKLDKYSDDGVYLRGFCEYSKGFRTFRKDRIQQVFDNETGEFLSVTLATQKLVRLRVDNKEVFEICFTGFKADDKAALIEKAKAHKMIVRDGVSTYLNFLCTGEKAGWKKLQNAEKQGVMLITADQFNDLVDFGVFPSSV